jgi:hypothetical protein
MRTVRGICVSCVLALALAVAACNGDSGGKDPPASGGGGGGALTDEQRSTIANEVRAANGEMVAAWGNEDAFQAWAGRFAEPNHAARHGGVPFLVVKAVTYATAQDVENTFRTMLADRRTNVTMGNESVAVLSPDAAVHFGEFTYTLTRGGSTEGPFAAAATSGRGRDGGTWKLLHYHQSWPGDQPVPAAGGGGGTPPAPSPPPADSAE